MDQLDLIILSCRRSVFIFVISFVIRLFEDYKCFSLQSIRVKMTNGKKSYII
jgi:hypothetical protein